jgi:hypothetical protein
MCWRRTRMIGIVLVVANEERSPTRTKQGKNFVVDDF